MHQGEEGRKAYEGSCRNKCCGGHAGNVDNGDWNVAAPLGKDGLPYGSSVPSPTQVAGIFKKVSDEEGAKKQEITHLVCRIGIDMTPEAKEVLDKLAAIRDSSVIRVTFRNAEVEDIPVKGRSLTVIVHDESYVIVDSGTESRMLPDQAIAYFPKDEVRSIVFVGE